MDNKFINFYGRTTGHLSRRAIYLLENLLPKYLLDMENFCAISSKYEKFNLEIGFGSGDFIYNSALANPNSLYLGAEFFANGVASLLDKIDKFSYADSEKKLSNILIYNSNVYYLLEKLQENIFDSIYILFPDPWHKTKHHKRRLINENNLKVFSKILKPNGVLRFVSDHMDYFNWSLKHISNSSNFEIINPQNFTKIPEDHFQTKYERKAIKEGRKIQFIEAKNIKN